MQFVVLDHLKWPKALAVTDNRIFPRSLLPEAEQSPGHKFTIFQNSPRPGAGRDCDEGERVIAD